uniref:Uncharacterized protein n=1 Tax=Opuntia streptacantha TaxID=393608 RepID=A0A7C9D4K1_OPUST
MQLISEPQQIGSLSYRLNTFLFFLQVECREEACTSGIIEAQGRCLNAHQREILLRPFHNADIKQVMLSIDSNIAAKCQFLKSSWEITREFHSIITQCMLLLQLLKLEPVPGI